MLQLLPDEILDLIESDSVVIAPRKSTSRFCVRSPRSLPPNRVAAGWRPVRRLLCGYLRVGQISAKSILLKREILSRGIWTYRTKQLLTSRC